MTNFISVGQGFKKGSLLFTALIALASCTKQAVEQSDALAGQKDRIFSVRPQNHTHFVAIIKLKTPALFETAQGTVKKIKIDEEQAATIKLEQDSMMEELKGISNQIQVLYRYRLVLNGIAILAPIELRDKLKGFTNINFMEEAGIIGRPKDVRRSSFAIRQELGTTRIGKTAWGAESSVDFIEGGKAHAQGIRGQGMVVGIIDTGIDFTHKMFGGVGTEEAYKAVDPNLLGEGFPNEKIVGGIDLVGTEFDSASAIPAKRIPHPDANPLDEAGHGTHVAGTVAGIGDGVETYDGVAPDAKLEAIKVFGKDGSTSDEVVIAALEYSADPSNDLKFEDQLDVVNMSLGSPYGSPHILYNEAIRNLVRGGTIVVASAGNSGNLNYIVGAPSISDDAISVAASIDNMDHNYKFRAVELSLGDETMLTEAVESSLTKPIAEVGDLSGRFVFLGLANAPLTEELTNAVKGNVALIDRGQVTFSEKIRRAAEAGAIGVVVVNNQDGDPFGMGGDGKFDIPAIMISKALGQKIKDAMNAQIDVKIQFHTDKAIEKPELIDNLTDFSSKGPRSSDGVIKPDVSSPGSSIISAEMGGGAKGVKMSGTSMAGPHVAGVMALLRQAHPTLSPVELKSVLMGSAKTIADKTKLDYSISRQGAGRVQIMKAVEQRLVSSPVSVSLGETQIEKRKSFRREIVYKNISAETLSADVVWDGSTSLDVQIIPSTITVEAGASVKVQLVITADAGKMTAIDQELDGWIKVKADGAEVQRVPVLLNAHKLTQMKASHLKIFASEADSSGARVTVDVQNAGVHDGEIYLFNSLGIDDRKEDQFADKSHNRECDVQGAGYKIITRDEDGRSVDYLQVAVKLYEPMTTWNVCELNVQVDTNNDGLADQEIAGVPQDRLEGLTKTDFATLFLDAGKAREIRKQFEADKLAQKPDVLEDYTPALLGVFDMKTFLYSTLAVVEVPVSELKLRPTGELAIKVSTTHMDAGAIEQDDFVGSDGQSWRLIGKNSSSQAYMGLPEALTLKAGQIQTLELTKGEAAGDLILFSPQNKVVTSSPLTDAQMLLLVPEYLN